jgi:carboxyl-terminal processing protease
LTKNVPFSPSPVLSRKQSILFFVTIALLTVTSFSLGYLAKSFLAIRSPQFSLLLEAYGLYRHHSYDPIPPLDKVQHGMIRGMLAAGTDPFTTFLDPPQNELQTNQLEGKFGGIGVRIDRASNGSVLLYPLPNSPAKNSGILDGDRLIAVDELRVKPDTDSNEIQSAIRGPVNSTVTVKIERGNESAAREFKLRRTEVAVPSVTFNISPNNPQVGVIQVNIIAATTADEIAKAITSLKTIGAGFFVLDLRNNGGGLVDGGVDSARLFLENDLVVMDEQFRGEPVKTFKTTNTGQYADIPLVILVNQNTASAAEILAGSLQYHHRAQLIGCKTYDKDSVQMIFDLSDGSSIHVTAGKWWLPEQQGLLGGQGLTPDYEISPDEAASPKAMELAIQLFTP